MVQKCFSINCLIFVFLKAFAESPISCSCNVREGVCLCEMHCGVAFGFKGLFLAVHTRMLELYYFH